MKHNDVLRVQKIPDFFLPDWYKVCAKLKECADGSSKRLPKCGKTAAVS